MTASTEATTEVKPLLQPASFTRTLPLHPLHPWHNIQHVKWFCRMIDSFLGHLRYEGSLCPSPWQCEFPLWSLSCNDLKAILGPLPSISVCGHSHSGSSVCGLTQSRSCWCEGSFGALSRGNFLFCFV